MFKNIKTFSGRVVDAANTVTEKIVDAASSATTIVGDLNGDGKIDAEDFRIAAEWTKKMASEIGDEATKLGRAAVASDLAKDVAAGAAVGAVVAVPVPIIGPAAGAVLGAGLGIYKNLQRPSAPQNSQIASKSGNIDVHVELLKLEDLRSKSIITDSEFDDLKQKILRKI